MDMVYTNQYITLQKLTLYLIEYMSKMRDTQEVLDAVTGVLNELLPKFVEFLLQGSSSKIIVTQLWNILITVMPFILTVIIKQQAR